MKCIFVLTGILTLFDAFAQDELQKKLIGVWKSLPPQDLIFNVYDEIGNYYQIYERENGSIGFFLEVYGFYENCDPKNTEDLKREGTGRYFFMIDDHALKGDSGDIIPGRLDCWAISINHDNMITGDYQPDSLYLHFSRRAILQYVKVYKLPEILEKYLEKEQPEVYQEYLKVLRGTK